MAKYHTEGIVKDVELTQEGGSFTLEPSAPYAIEEKDGDKTGKSILFVEERDGDKPLVFTQKKKAEGKDVEVQVPCCRTAFLAPPDSSFVFMQNAKPMDTATLLLLKQNRSKLRIVVVDGDISDANPTPGAGKFTISSITVK